MHHRDRAPTSTPASPTQIADRDGFHDQIRQAVHQLITRICAHHHVVAQRLRLGGTDSRILALLTVHGPLTPGRLGGLTGLSTGAVTGVIDRLERAGYARRVPDPVDRRRVRIKVTDHFYARADEIWHPVATEWHAQLARRFTGDQLDLITEFLDATNDLTRRHLERERPGPRPG